MKEISFLKQNSERWEAFEKMLENTRLSNPKKISELFIELTDDLAYARTYFPKSNTTKYLNNLTAKVHQEIYKNKKENKNRLWFFWKQELPFLLKQYHKQLLISFIITLIAVAIGFVSEIYDEDIVRLIVGDDYIDKTVERIKHGNGLGIYGEGGQVSMFFQITINNIFVSFKAYAFGLIFSLGTGAMLFYNGIMLGAFHAFFFRYGLLKKSLLVVWIHGSLEISAIIIAGCAGFVLGNSLLYPGTFTRLQSFKMRSKDSLKIVIGLIPVFIMAGFLESFITRYTNMPIWLSLFIIIVSLSFILIYFVIYPILLNRKINNSIN